MYSLTGHGNSIASPDPTSPHCVFSIAVSPDGKRFVSGSKDNLLKIWNAETGAQVSSFVE
jgi:WD40 repeat protein